MTLFTDVDVELELKRLGSAYTDPDCDAWLRCLTPEEVKATIVTPGGRIGNDAPFSRSRTDNWVARAGGLPRYIRVVARGLIKKGKTESEAIRFAIGIVRNWAEGKGNVSAKVRAASVKAIAQWEKMRATNKAKSTTKRVTRNRKSERVELETKGDNMEIQYKAVPVGGLTVDDEDQGIVTTLVSVTGMVDNVKDNILPGSYAKTLVARTPKGVWNHDWNEPISRTLSAKELLPGDKDLPKTQRNGDPWPANAGALKIQTQFNLETETGKKGFSNVKFFGDDQEWSIGYVVPKDGFQIDQKSGVRRIHTIDLYEYSPVLFGANPLASTLDVKGNPVEALVEYKSLWDQGNFRSDVMEYKNDNIDTEPYTDPAEEYSEDDDNPMMVQVDGQLINSLATLVDQVNEILEALKQRVGDNLDDEAVTDEDDLDTKQFDVWDQGEPVTTLEEKLDHGETAAGQLTSLVDEMSDFSDEVSNFDDLEDLADEFDAAVLDEDNETALQVAANFVEQLKNALEATDDEDASEAIKRLAGQVAEMIPPLGDLPAPDDETDKHTSGSEEDEGESDEETDGNAGEEEGASPEGDTTESKRIALELDTSDLADFGLVVS